ncbi:uncharacterized protein VP01_1639g4 [Puccinia sorghi]|uniref:Uncharacterized protein n=1 Tax=Puccinia sorghi TaxID=27349 RepID=A0A0L6VHA7_9BASI|nr:uncharacterized protein VP01_1639g4 [Puccinia sorghi]
MYLSDWCQDGLAVPHHVNQFRMVYMGRFLDNQETLNKIGEMLYAGRFFFFFHSPYMNILIYSHIDIPSTVSSTPPIKTLGCIALLTKTGSRPLVHILLCSYSTTCYYTTSTGQAPSKETLRSSVSSNLPCLIYSFLNIQAHFVFLSRLFHFLDAVYFNDLIVAVFFFPLVTPSYSFFRLLALIPPIDHMSCINVFYYFFLLLLHLSKHITYLFLGLSCVGITKIHYLYFCSMPFLMSVALFWSSFLFCFCFFFFFTDDKFKKKKKKSPVITKWFVFLFIWSKCTWPMLKPAWHNTQAHLALPKHTWHKPNPPLAHSQVGVIQAQVSLGQSPKACHGCLKFAAGILIPWGGHQAELLPKCIRMFFPSSLHRSRCHISHWPNQTWVRAKISSLDKWVDQALWTQTQAPTNTPNLKQFLLLNYQLGKFCIFYNGIPWNIHQGKEKLMIHCKPTSKGHHQVGEIEFREVLKRLNSGKPSSWNSKNCMCDKLSKATCKEPLEKNPGVVTPPQKGRQCLYVALIETLLLQELLIINSLLTIVWLSYKHVVTSTKLQAMAFRGMAICTHCLPSLGGHKMAICFSEGIRILSIARNYRKKCLKFQKSTFINFDVTFTHPFVLFQVFPFSSNTLSGNVYFLGYFSQKFNSNEMKSNQFLLLTFYSQIFPSMSPIQLTY